MKYANLFRFLGKYGCDNALVRLRDIMGRGEDFWGWEVFGMGILLNDDELCIASVRIHAGSDSDGRKLRHIMPENLPLSVRVGGCH